MLLFVAHQILDLDGTSVVELKLQIPSVEKNADVCNLMYLCLRG